MECNETKKSGPDETVVTLTEKCRRIETKLKETSSRRAKRNLQMELYDLKMELGWWLMDCKRHEEALALMSTLPWRTWGEPMCNGISKALAEMGRFDEAKRVLEKGLRRYPESYQLWVGMGVLYGNVGDHTESLRYFEKAIQVAPEDNWEAWTNKAIALEELGSYQDAVAILDGLFPYLYEFRGPKPQMKQFGDIPEIVTFVAEAIKKLVDEKGCSYSDIAILHTVKSPPADPGKIIPQMFLASLEKNGILSNWVSKDYNLKRSYDVTRNSVSFHHPEREGV